MVATIPKSTKTTWKAAAGAGRRRLARTEAGQPFLVGLGERADEEVARVGVGVDEVVDEDLPHVEAVERLRHLRAVDAGAVEGGVVEHLEVADVLQAEDVGGGAVPVDPRHAQPGSSAKSCAKCSAFFPSAARSSSARVVVTISSVSRVEVDPPPDAAWRSAEQRTASATAARSVSTITSMPGRRTLTTTCSPPGSRAACTCANEAAPSARDENSAKTSPRGRPKSSSMRATTANSGAGGTSSWRPDSSRVISVGRRSTRMERNWPSLISTPPISTASAR